MGTREAKIDAAAKAYREFMEAAGLPFNADSEDTPSRVARMFVDEYSKSRAMCPHVALFPSNGYDEYIAVRDIEFHSLCAHHHLPFSGVAHIAYHPNKHLAGLSKFARVVKHFAGRPTLQEHLTGDIAEFLFESVQPYVLMVLMKATHACMRCRGVRDPQSTTVTSCIKRAPQVHFDKDEILRLLSL